MAKITDELIDSIYRNEESGEWISPHLNGKLAYEEILKKLEKGEPLAFSRYGDGEFNAMFGKKGANCDGHEYFEDMGVRLFEILQSEPKYMMGIQPLALTVMEEEKLNFVKGLDVDWINSDCLHNASINEHLERFFKVLNNKKVCLIANSSFVDFPANHRWYEYLNIPSENCWNRYEEILGDCKTFPESDIYLFCASMMTNVLIDDLYKWNPNNTYIDCGSIFDPYVGKMTRSYHKKLKL